MSQAVGEDTVHTFYARPCEVCGGRLVMVGFEHEVLGALTYADPRSWPVLRLPHGWAQTFRCERCGDVSSPLPFPDLGEGLLN